MLTSVRRILVVLLLSVTASLAMAQGYPMTVSKGGSQFRIARLKYSGGSDWYNDPSSEPNLLRFIRQNSNIEVAPEYTTVDLASDDIFNYPFVFMTGHGNVEFSDGEARRLRAYL